MNDPLEPHRHIIDGARAFQAEAERILAPRTLAQEALAAVQQEPPTERPILIGIGGKLASGKDTLADYLVLAHGFEKRGMSDPLHTALYTLNPWIPHTPEGAVAYSGHNYDGITVRYRELIDDVGYTEAKRNPEVRRLLQVLGTEVGRDQLGAGTWANVARQKISALREEEHLPVIITGIRFENERAMIQELGGVLVWIERPEHENLIAIGMPEQSKPLTGHIGHAVINAIDDALDPARAQFHASEVTLTSADFDIVISNDAGIAELHAKADGLIAHLEAQRPSRESSGFEDTPARG